MYAIERRQEIKASNPELSFPEVTKILGNEWSTLDSQKKQVLPINTCIYKYMSFFFNNVNPIPPPIQSTHTYTKKKVYLASNLALY